MRYVYDPAKTPLQRLFLSGILPAHKQQEITEAAQVLDPIQLLRQLVLRSLNTIRKEPTIVAMILGWSTPDPGLGAPIQLLGGDAGGLFELLGIGKTLACQRITPEKAPPALLQIEPARPGRNEDVMDAGMFFQPGARLQARVTAEIVADDEQVAFGIVGFDIGEQRDVAFGVARSRTACQLFAITYPQRSIDPRLLRSAAIIHLRFDAMSVGRPAWGWGKGARHYGAEFVAADGRRPFRRLGVVGDDLSPFGTKSLSRAVPQLWV